MWNVCSVPELASLPRHTQTYTHTHACCGAFLDSADDGNLFIESEDKGYDAKLDEQEKSKEDGTAEVAKPLEKPKDNADVPKDAPESTAEGNSVVCGDCDGGNQQGNQTRKQQCYYLVH